MNILVSQNKPRVCFGTGYIQPGL